MWTLHGASIDRFNIKNGCIKCSEKNCKEFFHFYCAIPNGHYLSIKVTFHIKQRLENCFALLIAENENMWKIKSIF